MAAAVTDLPVNPDTSPRPPVAPGGTTPGRLLDRHGPLLAAMLAAVAALPALSMPLISDDWGGGSHRRCFT
jgi:hypothetical protein